MATEPKEKALTKKMAILQEQIGYCTDCMIYWCVNKGKIVYCSLRYRGVRSFYCENNHCLTKFD
ncbi:MAG: hypothetical protein ACTSQK_04755 [Candidatus Heimdallarchaeota archaeon]